MEGLKTPIVVVYTYIHIMFSFIIYPWLLPGLSRLASVWHQNLVSFYSRKIIYFNLLPKLSVEVCT